MKISIGIVALNEEKTIHGILSDVVAQSYPHDQIEVVLIDSGSTDRTKEIMSSFQKDYQNDFYHIQVLDNPGKIQAAGWNVAICNFTGDALVRVDAHASIPKDFIEKNVENFDSGEMVSGGCRLNMVDEQTPWTRTLLLAESSMFGSSIASYRRETKETKKKYVDSFFHGAYKREVLQKVGGFNEYLGRTEDNEFHYRIRQNGYQLCYRSDIMSYQHTRTTLPKMLRQKAGNGFWVGMTLGVCKGCLSIFHFVPFAFLLGIIGTTILGIVGYPLLGILMWGLYWVAAFAMSIAGVIPVKKEFPQLLLPFLFFLLHISYGVGTFCGILNMPFWRKAHKHCEAVDQVRRTING